MKKAFTLIELIMVIVVLGIVAVMGTDIVTSMYTNYLRSRAINQLEHRTNLALDMISKRLSYRIKESTIGRIRNAAGTGAFVSVESGLTENHQILEWIGYSNESLNGNGGAMQPGWSGLVDLYHPDTNLTTIRTPGSDLSMAGTIIQNLTDGDVTMANGRVAILFKDQSNPDINEYGWNGTDGNNTVKVTSNNNQIFNVVAGEQLPTDTLGNPEMTEHYYLAHSAYAIVPDSTPADTDGVFNLDLFYNYQPWNNERYTSNRASRTRIAENVSLFRFTQTNGMLVIKLCLSDNFQNIADKGSGLVLDGGGFQFRVCKQKVVE